MTIKDLLIEADAIQVGVMESDWRKVIELAASPLVANGYISESYSKAVIDNTLNHGAYYVFEEGIAIPHARPECGVKRNCFSLVVLDKPIQFAGWYICISAPGCRKCSVQFHLSIREPADWFLCNIPEWHVAYFPD